MSNGILFSKSSYYEKNNILNIGLERKYDKYCTYHLTIRALNSEYFNSVLAMLIYFGQSEVSRKTIVGIFKPFQ